MSTPEVSVAGKEIWNKRTSRVTIYVLSLVCATLLFFGGPDYYSPRAYRLAWDLGHLGVFFVWTIAALIASTAFAKLSLHKQLLVALPAILALGVSVEWMQGILGRSFALSDILNNLLGGGTAIVFASPSRSSITRRGLRAVQAVVLVLVLWQLSPLARVLIDDVIAIQQFPVLSDFETPFEVTRWHSRSRIEIDRQLSRHGKASLKVPLVTTKYSGAELQHFPSDWRSYEMLRVSIYNASSDPLRLTFSIYDRQHITNGQPYSDRFNTTLIFTQGWHDVEIPIREIESGPKGRYLDLRQVSAVRIVAVSLKNPRVMYIDNVRLEK